MLLRLGTKYRPLLISLRWLYESHIIIGEVFNEPYQFVSKICRLQSRRFGIENTINLCRDCIMLLRFISSPVFKISTTLKMFNNNGSWSKFAWKMIVWLERVLLVICSHNLFIKKTCNFCSLISNENPYFYLDS